MRKKEVRMSITSWILICLSPVMLLLLVLWRHRAVRLAKAAHTSLKWPAKKTGIALVLLALCALIIWRIWHKSDPPPLKAYSPYSLPKPKRKAREHKDTVITLTGLYPVIREDDELFTWSVSRACSVQVDGEWHIDHPGKTSTFVGKRNYVFSAIGGKPVRLTLNFTRIQ